ncbi:late promoter transcription accessory protein [bacterium]|nr:late promoter transcription accessory protein [bacterium]
MIELDSKVTVNNFQIVVEDCVHKKGMGYLEAIMWYCEQHNIEIEAVASLIKKSEAIKAKLEAECEEQNMIQKQPRLPV